jgi:UDP-N-acetylglucosamine--N-acetylmuramyl-(pentapeptide) pyrophosphoryl-undecaprenol N-acetylglucosamine transferase
MLYLKTFRPQVVLGVGGYVSLPLCYAAERLGVPTILHEQNKRLGMANRLLAPRATRILLSYPETLGDYPREKSRVVGNPVRSGFAHPPEARTAKESLGLDPSVPMVLVTGGSQGARTLNEAMQIAISGFAPDEAQFLWMTGKANAAAARAASANVRARVDVFPFIEDMVTACAAADLIVSRAGASTAAEIAVLGKPAVLVPYPYATDNHQEQNARALEAVGGAVLLRDNECTGERLGQFIRELLGDPNRLAAMSKAAGSLARPGAAEAIVEEILLLTFGGSP